MIDKEQDYSDRIGVVTLDVISQANSFNRWMYSSISPYLKDRVLEIGSGIGNITEFLVNDGYECSISDLRSEYCNILSSKFLNQSNVNEVLQIDLSEQDFSLTHKDLEEKFDSIFALNVIEHIENDAQALKNCLFMLKPKGHLIILVPAYQFLYNKFDDQLGHFKRYSALELSSLMQNLGLRVLKKQYFNFLGIFGWYVSGNLMRNSAIPGGQMKLFNRLVPFIKILDRLVLNRIGLSTIVVGVKNNKTYEE